MILASASPIQRRLDFAWRSPAAPPGWLLREETIMGTAVRVELWADERRAGDAAAASVMGEMLRIDRAMSPHRTESELSRINRNAARTAVPLSDEMYLLVERALGFSRLSGGAFDISSAAAGPLIDRRQRERPNAKALEPTREQVSWRHLELDERARSLRFARPGMRIDLGGLATGHGVDRAATLLLKHGVSQAWVSAGGASRTLGDRSGWPWSVALRDPHRADAVLAVLPLQDRSISTSGARAGFVHDGARAVHELVDTAAGLSPSPLRSVTVLALDGVASEALSQVVFVLGVERGLALIESLPDVEALVVDAQGELHVSSGLLPER